MIVESPASIKTGYMRRLGWDVRNDNISFFFFFCDGELSICTSIDGKNTVGENFVYLSVKMVSVRAFR